MALGKSGLLFVRAGEFDIEFKDGQQTPAEMGEVLTDDLIANLKTATGDVNGDTIVLEDWLVVCRVDLQNPNTRQNVDSSDTCSGPYGSSVPGPPDVSLTWNSYKKVGEAYARWQALMFDRWENAEATGDDGHVTALYLDGAPKGIIQASIDRFPKAISKARGRIMICKVLNATENQPYGQNMELNFELRPSGDSIYQIPARAVTMAE